MKYKVNFHAEIVIKGMIKAKCIITRKKKTVDEEQSKPEELTDVDWKCFLSQSCSPGKIPYKEIHLNHC